jgi:tetratricopeptide (TPR) repeat protein
MRSGRGPSIAFHPDGRRIFGGYGNLVQVWDTQSSEPLLLLRGHTERIVSIALSADGSRLASAAEDGTVHIRDARSAYDPEVQSLVGSLFLHFDFANVVMEKLRTDPRINESIRKKALLLAQQQGEQSPIGHIRAAKSARAAGARRTVYEVALKHARAACELAPWDWEAFNAQGAIQYRLGAYRDALSSLLHAAELRVRPSITNLAFEAMTYHGLGEYDRARFALAEAKRLLESPDTTAPEPELVALIDEARTVVESAYK